MAADGHSPFNQSSSVKSRILRGALNAGADSVAYHLSHYLSLLVINGQLMIPLISDPLGLGWDLFGTVSYRVDIGAISPAVVWYTAMTLIVIGHVIAVVLAHGAAIRVFGSRSAALASQIPMVR